MDRRDFLKAALAAGIVKRFAEYSAGHKPFIGEYRRRSLLTGRKVEITRGSERFFAEVTGIGDDFSLLVKTSDGRSLALTSGEASLRVES